MRWVPLLGLLCVAVAIIGWSILPRETPWVPFWMSMTFQGTGVALLMLPIAGWKRILGMLVVNAGVILIAGVLRRDFVGLSTDWVLVLLGFNWSLVTNHIVTTWSRLSRWKQGSLVGLLMLYVVGVWVLGSLTIG